MESLPPRPRLSERPRRSAAERLGRAALFAVLASGGLLLVVTALAVTYYFSGGVGGSGLPYEALTGRAYAACLVVAFAGGVAGVASGSRDGRRASWFCAGVGVLAFVLPRLLNALFP